MSLTICKLGEAILTQPASRVLDVRDPVIQILIEEMLMTVQEAQGVGLSAPQVGVSVQVLILTSRPHPRYPQAPDMDPLVVINPHILQQSEQRDWGWEGCLSVPDQRGLVQRFQSVVVEYTNVKGEIVIAEWSDFIARVFQHEYDHLRGKLFLDQNPRQILNEAEYLAQVRV